MSTKNRTRHAQQQYIDFMKDAGCDIFEIQAELKIKPEKHNSTFKKPLCKQIDVNGQLAYPARRHKKIQKQPKFDQRDKLMSKLSYSGTGNFSVDEMEPTETHLQKFSLFQPQIPNTSVISSTLIQKLVQELPSPPQKLFQFPQCVNKAGNNFYGYFGHSTILLTKPIIEGAYYMQVTMLNEYQPHHPKGKKFQSCIRVGICKSNYRMLVPLGGQNSYCYKTKGGVLIHDHATIEQSLQPEQTFKEGDTIGMLLELSAPYRWMKENDVKNEVNEGSRLCFYKNGVKVAEVKDIKQNFYHFGISLFNWANINVNLGPEWRWRPEGEHGYKPVGEIFEEEIVYQDLKV